MEKFNLHESLRIYLPGLLLTGLLYVIVNQTIREIQLVLVPAIFVGFLVNSVIWNFHVKSFKTITDTYLLKVSHQNLIFFDAWKLIILTKVQRFNTAELKQFLDSKDGSEIVEFVERSFFSKRFELVELNYFRSPKSFGIMCYNLAFVCKISAIFSVCFGFYEGSKMTISLVQLMPYLGIALVLLLSCYLFLRNSKQYFIQSLSREIHYWESVNEAEMSEVVKLIELWGDLNIKPKDDNTGLQPGISVTA
jgi:hypothetical protein